MERKDEDMSLIFNVYATDASPIKVSDVLGGVEIKFDELLARLAEPQEFVLRHKDPAMSEQLNKHK